MDRVRIERGGERCHLLLGLRRLAFELLEFGVAGVLGRLEVLGDPAPDVALHVDRVAGAQHQLVARRERGERLVDVADLVAGHAALLQQRAASDVDAGRVAPRLLEPPLTAPQGALDGATRLPVPGKMLAAERAGRIDGVRRNEPDGCQPGVLLGELG